MITFGTCCAGAAIDPFNRHMSRSELAVLDNSGYYIQTVLRPIRKGQKVRATSRFAFLASSPKNLFHCVFRARVEMTTAYKISGGHDTIAFADGNPVTIGVPGSVVDESVDYSTRYALFSNPGSRVEFGFSSGIDQSMPYFYPSTFPESTDSTREIRLKEAPVGSGLPYFWSYVWRRSDLIAGTWNGVSYLMTPEYFIEAEYIHCFTDDVLHVLFAGLAEDPLGDYTVSFFPSGVSDGNVETEGFWLYDLQQVTT